ncbi:serine/threonine-protein kinase [Mycolicibacterium goodii]|uniref:non-specific serine/threonine protein kinase n=1 Tax=Mycolicibacterium goodii TaxID=134601 RepID=A0A0K0XEQ8_MYCGD|nr:protein kinase [Mycolicibacterium goodii]
MALSQGAKIAGYTIERMLGSGGMGEVYLAQHPRLPRHDALKVLRTNISADPDYVERFNREADLAAKLWHPHIVGIHDRGKHRGRLWISMDFVDGTDASRLVHDHHPDGMPVTEVLEIVKAVASALDYAHGRGLLHRDVKPANILISDGDLGERRILLGDFGVARDLGDNVGNGLTATNMTVGTAAYAAPEQLMGADVDGRADQYSLAATTYHLLTGGPLFDNSNPAVVISQHLNAPAPALGDSRPEMALLDEAMSRALAKNPDDRFATCTEFASALEEPMNFAAPATAPVISPNDVPTMLSPVALPPMDEPAVTPPPNDTRYRRVAFVAAGAAAVVAVVAAAAALVKPTDQAPTAAPFTISGTLQLPSDGVRTKGLPSGFMCAGVRDYGDIGPETPITVEDESGKLLAKGGIQSSSKGSDGCFLKFRVDDVPSGARFYRVHVAQRAEMSYTEEEAKAGVQFLLGNVHDEPTTTTAAPSQAKASPPPTATRTVTVTPSAVDVSLQRLRALAGNDRPYVAAMLADRWVPQISSKRVGLVADGVTWDNAMILDQHMRMRATYPDVRLLWSGDWSTYDGRDFWVTIVGLTADNAGDVLAWCRSAGFDRDNCAAKIVSTWRPIAGSTKYN